MKSKESVAKLTIQEYEELLKRANKCIGIMQDALQKIGFEFEGRVVEIVHKAETEAMEALFLKDQTEGNDCSSETPLKSQTPVPPSLPSILQEEKEPTGSQWDKIHKLAGNDIIDMMCKYHNGAINQYGLMELISKHSEAAFRVGRELRASSPPISSSPI